MRTEQETHKTEPGSFTKLQNPWRWIAKVIWILIAALCIYITLAGLPLRFELLSQSVAEQDSKVEIAHQLYPSEEEILEQNGVSLRAYAIYILFVELGYTTTFFLTAGIIFWFRSDDWLAILVSLGVLTLGITVPAIDDVLAYVHPGWHWPVETIQAFSSCSFNIAFFLFPSGQFVPRWTRWLAIGGSALIVAWLIFPDLLFNPIYGDTWNRTPIASYMVAMAWITVGIYAQIYRYHYNANTIEKQQIKWIAFGYAMISIVGVGIRYLPTAWLESPVGLEQTSLLGLRLVNRIFGTLIAALVSTALPISYGIAILRYRLWDIDTIIRRTIIYGLLTLSLVLIHAGVVTLSQSILHNIITQSSMISAALSTVVIISVFQPLRYHFQQGIDQRFYRNRIDFQQAFTEFSEKIRTIYDLDGLLEFLTVRTAKLFRCDYGAVFLRDSNNNFQIRKAPNLPQDLLRLTLPTPLISRLRSSVIVTQADARSFSLFLPLTTFEDGHRELIGILALGPRSLGQPFTSNDLSLLTSLGDKASEAIALTQLIEYQASPAGQAAYKAQDLIEKPNDVVLTLYKLAREIGEGKANGTLLNNLPIALNERNSHSFARLAEGFNNLVKGQLTSEALRTGLHCLVEEFGRLTVHIEHNDRIHYLLTLCDDSLNITTISHMVQLLPNLDRDHTATDNEIFENLFLGLEGLRPVLVALHNSERLRSIQDKRTHLLDALSRIKEYEQKVLPNLCIPDRYIFRGIRENWEGIIQMDLDALSRQAQISFLLITNHVRASKHVPLVLELINVGTSPATRVNVELLPSPAYEIGEETREIEQLIPGQRVQVEFSVSVIEKRGFDVIFRADYDDEQRAGKNETFSSYVQLLSVPAEYVPIPNPYIPGRPLAKDSPIFFGRQDTFNFIRQSLKMDLNGCILLLTGPKRMGKTSILKQLPSRLDERYITVELDGQALGIDPGLSNFFYDVSLKIAKVVDVPVPPLEDFVRYPSITFESKFLPNVLDVVNDKRLLILFDEFEEIEMRVKNKKLEVEIFPYLRHIIQDFPKIAFAFVGTHRPEELELEQWSTFFNLALHKRIGFLDRSNADELIQTPVKSLLYYDDLAIEKMIKITSGHPYFLQVLCYILVNDANQERRNYIDITHVDRATDQAIDIAAPHLGFIWQKANPIEKRVLQSLAKLITSGVFSTQEAIFQYIEKEEHAATYEEIVTALSSLLHQEILWMEEQTEAYGFVVDLLRLSINQRI